jgi:hypothetical protein
MDLMMHTLHFEAGAIHEWKKSAVSNLIQPDHLDWRKDASMHGSGLS